MKTETLSRLRSEALTLPEAERAELAHTLVTSLNAPADTMPLNNGIRKFCTASLKSMMVLRGALIEMSFNDKCETGLTTDSAPCTDT